MDNVKAIGGGLGAAAACLVVWSAIAFLGGVELGIFAIIVGVAVGVAIRQLAKPQHGVDLGVLAVLIALATILVGKFAATTLVTESQKYKVLGTKIAYTENDLLVQYAIPFAKQRIRMGTPIAWRNGKSLSTATTLDDFPDDIVKEVREKWDRILDKEGELKLAADQERHVRYGAVNALRKGAFGASFTLLNILWIVIALPAAFFLGAGSLSAEDEDGRGLARAAVENGKAIRSRRMTRISHFRP
jgi:hypothetical protein